MQITIKPAQGSDERAILRRLHTVCLPGDTLPDFTTGLWWIMRHQNMPVGFCGMRASFQWAETGYLSRAGIIPEYRGKRLQRKLIQVRIRHARKVGWKYLITDTRQNPPSANSLIRCGFKTYLPIYPWSFKDAIYWIKNLQTHPAF